MLINEIKITSVDSDTRLVGIAQFTIDNLFVIHDIKIIKNTLENEDAYFLAMPSKQVKEKFLDIAHPISKEGRNSLERLIIPMYQYLQTQGCSMLVMAYDETKARTSLLEQEFRDFTIEILEKFKTANKGKVQVIEEEVKCW